MTETGRLQLRNFTNAEKGSVIDNNKTIFSQISHEIRTPLNAVVGLSRLLSIRDLPPREKELAEGIKENAEVLLQVINIITEQQNPNISEIRNIVYAGRQDPHESVQPRENHILLVEDYPTNAMVVTMMLEEMGYTVDQVTDGEEAVEKIRQAEKPYEAILMDVQMIGMDGFEATREIRRLERGKGFHHAIIGVTAHALAGDREKCIEAGMDDYLSKPLNPDILSQKLLRLRKQK